VGLKFARGQPFKTIVQIQVAIALLLFAEGCSLGLRKSADEADAGDAGTSEATGCAQGARVCFGEPSSNFVSWGLTSISVREPLLRGALPTVFVSSNGTSKVFQLEPASTSLETVDFFKAAVAPWQTASIDFDLDGIEDLAVASPGKQSHLGEVSFWNRVSERWSLAGSLTIGLGTYSVGTRNSATAEAVFAIAASYDAQSLVPLIAHKGAVPTAGTSISLDLKPTALAFGKVTGQENRLYVIGDGSNHGKLVEFEVQDRSVTKISKSPEFGHSLNDLRVGDLNNDSMLDAIAIDDSAASSLYSLISDANHNWTVAYQLPLPAYSHAGVLDDFDRDGLLDVAVISGSTNTIRMCFGDGHGAFGKCLELLHGLEQATNIASVDLNSDNWKDLAVVSFEGKMAVLHAHAVE